MCDFGSINTYNIDFNLMPHREYDYWAEKFEKQTTFMYRPPEMCDPYLKYKVNTKVDMWMLGGVLFTLMFFKHPFVDCSKMGIINASYFYPVENKYSQKLENFIRNLLTPNPELRPSSIEVDNLLTNWYNLNSIPLNLMANKIKIEHQRRIGNFQPLPKSVIKLEEIEEKKEDKIEFDFSGLNRMSKTP